MTSSPATPDELNAPSGDAVFGLAGFLVVGAGRAACAGTVAEIEVEALAG